jgi:hypothetical protein
MIVGQIFGHFGFWGLGFRSAAVEMLLELLAAVEMLLELLAAVEMLLELLAAVEMLLELLAAVEMLLELFKRRITQARFKDELPKAGTSICLATVPLI